MDIAKRYRVGVVIVFLLVAQFTLAQHTATDTPATKIINIDEVVVTATRTEKSIGDIPVPVQVITKKMIQQTGSQKLIEVLQQQTGVIQADNPLGQALQGYPNPFGSGIQLQGLDPAYTIILMDGEPLTGRNAGVLNMGRIAIGNIKQIEIIKGPTTSLYGSDALAGVINIITEQPKQKNSSVQLHHGTNNTWGFTANTTMVSKKVAAQFFANRYSSSGYDLDATVYGKTADPFRNYSFAGKLNYTITNKLRVQSSARLFTQKQFNNYLVFTGTQPEAVDGASTETDWSISNQLYYTPTTAFTVIARLYATGYKNDAAVYLEKTNQLFDKSFLYHSLLKPELQIEAGKKHNQKFIAGIGYNYETINASRYSSSKDFNAAYFFVQKEWLLRNKLNITAGGRLDKHTLYAAQFNPKLAASYKILRGLTVIGSVGTGFKAPDFRQQFLNFSNSLVGYTLFGANELGNGLQQLQQQGLIAGTINITPFLTLEKLLPEKSTGFNIGLRYQLRTTNITANAFYNNINNLIDRYSLPFTKINNQSIFSYANFNNVFTQGFDVNVSRQLNKRISISSGYQFLQTGDKAIIDKIQSRELVKRDPVTFVSSYVTRKEYGGLFNRSKHTANALLAYSNVKNTFTASARAVFRSRFGYSDVNGNTILDDDREYAAGFTLVNTAVSANITKGIEVQTGVDNVLNYRDANKLPGLFGRTCYVNCNINISQLFINYKNNRQ